MNRRQVNTASLTRRVEVWGDFVGFAFVTNLAIFGVAVFECGLLPDEFFSPKYIPGAAFLCCVWFVLFTKNRLMCILTQQGFYSWPTASKTPLRNVIAVWIDLHLGVVI